MVPYYELFWNPESLWLLRTNGQYLPVSRLYFEAKGKNKIGSTQKGIGPTYIDKTARNGLRVGDINSASFREKYEELVAKHKLQMSLYNFSYNLPGAESKWFESIEFMKKFKHIDTEFFIND